VRKLLATHQHGLLRKYSVLAGAFAAVALGVVGVFAATPRRSSQPAVLGDTTISADWRVSIDKQQLTATASKQRLSLTVNLTNHSQSLQQVSPGLQMFVTDSAGRRVSATAQYVPAGVTVGGPLNPGVSRVETIDFELEAGVKPQTFRFEPDGAAPALEVKL
jgi:hypothetical protein